MVFELDDLRERPRVFDLALPLPELIGEDGALLLAAPARIRGQAGPAAGGVELEARIDAELRLVCSRCLESFVHPVGIDLSLRLIADAEEFARQSDDPELFLAAGGVVDLADVVGEQLYLWLPLKPVCSPGCRGLCPSCGTNRNAIECGCSAAPSDGRLAPLGALRLRGNDGEAD